MRSHLEFCGLETYGIGRAVSLEVSEDFHFLVRPFENFPIDYILNRFFEVEYFVPNPILAKDGQTAEVGRPNNCCCSLKDWKFIKTFGGALRNHSSQSRTETEDSKRPEDSRTELELAIKVATAPCDYWLIRNQPPGMRSENGRIL